MNIQRGYVAFGQAGEVDGLYTRPAADVEKARRGGKIGQHGEGVTGRSLVAGALARQIAVNFEE
ncbi:MAG TPA: hypothetical protein VMV79_05290 [Alphaproteobacteria bacterium]|nr:hypothetical protein [Alphaproteobacteria bacterium]